MGKEVALLERAGPKTGDASTRYALEFRRLEMGEEWTVAYLAVRDLTSATTSIDIYKDGHGYKHYLAQQKPGVAGSIYYQNTPFKVFDGETLVVEFVGGGVADAMEAWATGTEIRGGP